MTFLERENLRVDILPAIFIYFDKSYFMYTGDKNSLVSLLHFINKIITPMIELENE